MGILLLLVIENGVLKISHNTSIFNKRKTIRNNIDDHLKYCNSEIEEYRKQSFSEQRVNIIPNVFKQISLNYLNNIG